MLDQFRIYTALRLYPGLLPQLRRLRETNTDLMVELERYKSAKPMTASQWEDVARVIREHQMMKDEQDAIVVWLRGNRPEVFTEGGDRRFSDLVIGLINSAPKPIHYSHGRTTGTANPENFWEKE